MKSKRHSGSKPKLILPGWAWYVAAALALGISIWTAGDMIALENEELLWGYRPLTLLAWSYFSLSFLWNGLRKTSGQELRNYLLATVIAILMSISFPPVPMLILILPAWAGIIYLAGIVKTRSVFYQFRLFYHTFFVWNIITTYWISNTAFSAGIVAMAINTLLMTIPILLFNKLVGGLKRDYHFICFASCWLAFEFLHFRWEAHWPWLTLGHYFMDTPWMVQWYSWTGVLGGSLWILALSWLTYQLVTFRSRKFFRAKLITFATVLILPLVFSVFLGSRFRDKTDGVQVAVVQPNMEPHYVKGKVPQLQEWQRFMSLAKEVVTDSTDYLVFPETSFNLNLKNWNNSRIIRDLRTFLEPYPGLTVVSGFDSHRILRPGDQHDRFTRTFVRNGDTIYWENHNSAICLTQDNDLEIYYKSKLVPGAEFFPFKRTLFFMKPLMDKLGGSGSGLRMQSERSVFEGLDGYRVAPVICYESVFGEYVSDYVKSGAQWIAVMTNDGWWDDTAGHKQHLGLSRLRAIEQRKWIARSANSGISCFITPKGKVIKPTKYNEEASISSEIYPNSVRTIYNRIGDFIGRLALLLTIGFILFRLKVRYFKMI